VRRVALLVCVAACGSSAPAVAPRPALVAAPSVDAAVPAESAALEDAPIVHRPPLRPRIESPHGGSISAIAVTREGDAALTVDDRDGMRLYATLDGTRPPVVVDLPPELRLVLAHRGDAFAVALRDSAGGLVLATLDRDGRTLTRTAIDSDPRVDGLVALDAGMLAWRADETLALYADDGRMLARLATDPGQRIVTISAIPGGAIAIVQATSESGGTTARARALIATPHSLAWGASLEVAMDVEGKLAISPQGRYLARVEPGSPSFVTSVNVIELASGRTVASETATQRDLSIGFIDEEHAVVSSSGRMTWLAFDGTDPIVVQPAIGTSHSRSPQPLATGHGIAVTASFNQLVLSNIRDVHYLAYGLAFTRFIQPDGHGGVLAAMTNDSGIVFAEGDHDLKFSRQLSAPVNRLAFYTRVGSDEWAVASQPPEGDHDHNVRFAVLDVAHDVWSPQTAEAPMLAGLEGAPSTHLVGMTGIQPVSLLQFDAATHALWPIALQGKPKTTASVRPVDPALADGTRVVRIVDSNSTRTVQWLRDETARPTKAIDVAGTVLAVDPAGHVYVDQTATPHDVLVFGPSGELVATLPQQDPNTQQLWPSPRGTLVAMRTAAGLSMYGLDGKRKWVIRVRPYSNAIWTDDDTLVLQGPAGIGRLDAATGAMTATTCGWQFGLSAKPPPFGVADSPWCAAPP
jgi:hypothetical protein